MLQDQHRFSQPAEQYYWLLMGEWGTIKKICITAGFIQLGRHREVLADPVCNSQLKYIQEISLMSFFDEQVLLEGDYRLQAISVEAELGRGNSRVHAVKILGESFAMKQLTIHSDYEYHSFLKQISMLKSLSASNDCLIRYEGYFVTVAKKDCYSKGHKFAYIVMQYAEMNLSNLVALKFAHPNCRFSQIQIDHLITTLLKGFADLEKNNVAHCDIKPENILVLQTEPLRFKICDVGSSKVADAACFQEATIQGTLPFLAPEVLEQKGKKLTTLNPFRSDVFSFGLLILFVATGKKFSSKDRLEVSPSVYHQIIQEWIKQAGELIDSQLVKEVLREALSFDSHRRNLFKELKVMADGFARKKKLNKNSPKKQVNLASRNETRYQRQNQTIETNKISKPSVLQNPKSVTNINFNTRKRLTGRVATNKSNSKKSSQEKSRKYSNEMKKTSPNTTIRSQKMKTTLSSEFSIDRSKVSQFTLTQKILYVDKETHDFIPYQTLQEEAKIFVLLDACVGFKNAAVVTMLKSCPVEVLYKLAETKGKSLNLQYANYEGVGLDENAPMLDYEKIYLNLQGSSIEGGYNNLLRALCPIYLKKLHLRLTGSEIVFKDVSLELDRLKNRDIKSLRLAWSNNFLQLNDHQQFVDKISRLSLKELEIDQSSNYIQTNQQTRWKLPTNLKTLTLNYSNNFMGPALSSLALSLKDMDKLQELSLNFSHNGLTDADIKILIQSLSSLSSLDKLFLDLGNNPVQNGSYAFEGLAELKNIRSLEVRINKCSLTFQHLEQILKSTCKLFDYKLKLLNIGYDRSTPIHELETDLQPIIQSSNLKMTVIPTDYKYVMMYLEKKPKRQMPNMIRIRTKKDIPNSKKNMVGNGQYPYQQDKGNSMPCPSLYSSEPLSEAYICITCSLIHQTYKSQIFCKACVTHCQHHQRAKHRLIKTHETRRCNCVYNAHCTAGEEGPAICAEIMGIVYKKLNRCQFCAVDLCHYCASGCKQMHPESIHEKQTSSYFKCEGPLLGQHMLYHKESCCSALLPN